jgi:hypothetical protein
MVLASIVVLDFGSFRGPITNLLSFRADEFRSGEFLFDKSRVLSE